jgi:hypothetical protein
MTSARRKELEKYASNPVEFGGVIPSHDELLEYIVFLLTRLENLESDYEQLRYKHNE